MDANTRIIQFKILPFRDDDSGGTGTVPDVRDERALPRALQKADDQKGSSNTLPEAILRSWSRIARANMSVRMYGDLVRIANQPPGWRGPGSLRLRPASLKNFLEFWSIVRNDAAEPELALAPDGTLHAEWFKSQRQRLDVRFLEHKVVFGLIASNSILEGAEQQNTVAQILKSHHAQPLSWSGR
jgi:hypothetical protein